MILCIVMTLCDKTTPNNTCQRGGGKNHTTALNSKYWGQTVFPLAKWKNPFLVFDCCSEIAALKTAYRMYRKNERILVFKLSTESIYLEWLQAEGRRVHFLTSRDNPQHFYVTFIFFLKKNKNKKHSRFIELPWRRGKKNRDKQLISHLPLLHMLSTQLK